MRVLVVFEDDYRAYREVIAAGIRALRPRTEVQTADVDVLEEEVRRFEPHLVICSRPNALDTGGLPACVELSLEPLQPSRICVGGRYSEQTNPSQDALLAVIDEVEQLLQTKNDLRCC